MTAVVVRCPKEALAEIVSRMVDTEASLGEKLMLALTMLVARTVKAREVHLPQYHLRRPLHHHLLHHLHPPDALELCVGVLPLSH